MSASAAPSPLADGPDGSVSARATAKISSVLLAILITLLLGVALTWSRAELVWTSGAFFDSDDAMRAVQVRDLLAGQNWFDMSAMRLDPPSGVFMHWSRIVDAPLAALEIMLQLISSPETAERATRLIFPFAMLAWLYALAARNARILAGDALRLPAILMIFLSGAVFGQFTPGRIDHHAPQIVLLMASVGFYLQGLDPLRAGAMAFAAAAMAISFAISLENLPFFVVMLAFVPALFIFKGDAVRFQLAWFALGAFVAFPLCFAMTVAPSRYFASACDAYSAVHLLAALVIALAYMTLFVIATRLRSLGQRLVGVAVAGGVALMSVIAVAPQCIGDPLVALDPLLRELWLSHVIEAKPLSYFIETNPNIAVMTAAPVVFGLLASLLVSWRAQEVARLRWLAMSLFIGIGLLCGLWQLRVFSSVTPLAMAPLAFAASALAHRASGSFSILRTGLTASFCLTLSPVGIALALPSSSGEPQGADLSCLKPEFFEPLNALPPSQIVAPVEIGAHLLAHTRHFVFAAPYHRDNHGNRIAVDAFLAPPDEAKKILRAAGAELVVWCHGGRTASPLIQKSPEGLASALMKGAPPHWLEPAPMAGSPYLVFAIRAQD